jgi:hypothetical protein
MNTDDTPVHLEIADGIQNILPYGIDKNLQLHLSTLADGYKKNELLPDTGLGLYTLSSLIVDKPEPYEALKATVVWSDGWDQRTLLLSSLQLDLFRTGHHPVEETAKQGMRGAYFVCGKCVLRAREQKEWHIVSDVNRGPSDVAALIRQLRKPGLQQNAIEDDIAHGTEDLIATVAAADGLQCTGDCLSTSRHFANVMYNIMRGGIFYDNSTIPKADYVQHVNTFNMQVAQRHARFLDGLADTLHYPDLLRLAGNENDPDLLRITCEYLPLTLSRRHGDPSRPWNDFVIDIKNHDGSKKLNYQGNWRDIFQNWEALSRSFSLFTTGMICRFVNASTADGYNPYRISRNGIEWETNNPDDPWSSIGYWGDHQIVYLCRFLELSRNHCPELLEGFLTQPIFSYANVPYRIREYRDLLDDPRHTIIHDKEQEIIIAGRVQVIGSDGKLIWDSRGRVYLVNLAEKLLVPLLAKLSNFIPEGGVWLNTQRPEWNDAHNALAGLGVSTVTLSYLRRYLTLCRDIFASLKDEHLPLSAEVAHLLVEMHGILNEHRDILKSRFTNRQRRMLLDELGSAGSRYRSTLYVRSFSGKQTAVTKNRLIAFIETCRAYIDHSICCNRRADNLYHSYNLMTIDTSREISLSTLPLMLEGQIAILSSGLLSAGESVVLLDALRKSVLYRKDQQSYLLYPDSQLPRFMDKNIIPADIYEKSALLKRLVEISDTRLVEKDVLGAVHFNGSCESSTRLKTILEELACDPRCASLVEKEYTSIMDIYEAVFNHRAFTGRSGTFYKYEGLGCIYWHAVSKLLLAVQETCLAAFLKKKKGTLLKRLIEQYYAIRAGLGLNKTPDDYGAFPLDPYSHTPRSSGAQQPGMTGQVKEDIITRMGELGVFVRNGHINFMPFLLRKTEFLTRRTSFTYYDLNKIRQTIRLEKDSLCFTCCQVPIVYTLAGRKNITILKKDGTSERKSDDRLDIQNSQSVFNRTGEIIRIEVTVLEKELYR